MKLISFWLAILALVRIPSALALNPIEARVGPVRVFVMSPAAVFASEHVSRNFNAISLSIAGEPYQPTGPNWIRFTDSAGSVVEDSVENFSISRRDKIGFDGVVLTPYRQFPVESVETLAFVAAGDPVLVSSRASGATVEAKVTFVSSSDFTVTTTYPARDSDSGSVVTTKDGVLVGLVSASIREDGKDPTGSVVTVPPISPTFLSGTKFIPGRNDPAAPIITTPSNPVVVVMNAPIAPLPTITPDEAYKRGFSDGRASALKELKADVEGLLVRIKSLQ